MGGGREGNRHREVDNAFSLGLMPASYWLLITNPTDPLRVGRGKAVTDALS